MASPELKTITEMLRARQEQAPADISFPESRAMFEQMTAAFPAPPGVTSTPVDAGGIPAEWIAAQGASDEQTIYWLHGGGYCIGSINTHRGLLARISAASRGRVLAIDYRLAPEHPFRRPWRTPLRAISGCCPTVSIRRRSSSVVTRLGADSQQRSSLP